MQLLERYSIEHKDVKVCYEINYRDETISLINPDGTKKQWLFYNRWLEYMDWWRDILEAMKIAISEAEEKLQKYKDEKIKAIAMTVKEIQEWKTNIF